MTPPSDKTAFLSPHNVPLWAGLALALVLAALAAGLL